MEQYISNENHNDFHWKNELENVSNLPDAILANKNATWGKLHDRLHQKPGRLKLLWYGMVAASLLFAILMSVTMYNRTQNVTIKSNIVKVPSKKETIGAMLTSKENTAIDVPTFATKKKAIQMPLQVGKKMLLKNDIVMEKETRRRPQLKDQTGIIMEPVISPAALDSNGVNTHAIALVKKRLKVVHINELPESFTETPNIAFQPERHFFQIKLINQPSYTSTSLPSVRTGFTIFKTTKASLN